MARIKVTGYLDTADLSPEDIDLQMGLSNEGYEKMADLLGLDETEFELER